MSDSIHHIHIEQGREIGPGIFYASFYVDGAKVTLGGSGDSAYEAVCCARRNIRNVMRICASGSLDIITYKKKAARIRGGQDSEKLV